jgi:hypothetical protein
MAAPEPDEQPQHLPRREGSQVRTAGDGDVRNSPRLLVVLVGMRLEPALRVVCAFDVVNDFAIVVIARVEAIRDVASARLGGLRGEPSGTMCLSFLLFVQSIAKSMWAPTAQFTERST